MVAFGVAADGSSGRLRLPDGFSLSKYTVGAANPSQLDEHLEYVVAAWRGTLEGGFGASALPKPWYVYYDWSHQQIKIRAATGSLFYVR